MAHAPIQAPFQEVTSAQVEQVLWHLIMCLLTRHICGVGLEALQQGLESSVTSSVSVVTPKHQLRNMTCMTIVTVEWNLLCT